MSIRLIKFVEDAVNEGALGNENGVFGMIMSDGNSKGKLGRSEIEDLPL